MALSSTYCTQLNYEPLSGDYHFRPQSFMKIPSSVESTRK